MQLLYCSYHLFFEQSVADVIITPTYYHSSGYDLDPQRSSDLTQVTIPNL